MSSNPLERLMRSFTFRLSVGYATLFTFSAAILFGLLYVLLASTCKARIRKSLKPGSRMCGGL
jgi:ABC-type multidrug transport system permease subunit